MLAVFALTGAACGGDARHTAPPATTHADASTTSTTTTTAPGTSTSTAPPIATTTTTTVTPPTVPTSVAGAAVQVRRGNPARAAVAFSFDAGSDAGHTEAILDVLRRNGIRATFSLTGDWVRDNQGLAREVAAAHDLMNHGDTHRSFTGFSTATRALTRDERVQEVVQADRTIRGVTGVSPAPWFRPPYGDTDASVDRDLATAGYRYDVLWTVDSLGWKGTAATAVVDRCLARAENGAIFLFHVGSASTDIDALDSIIAGLRARGYAIGTVASVL